MEKVADNKNLLNSLGALINKKIKTIAQEKKDHLSLEDDAVEHAKAYRMLGWSWDQIDTILEDMEFEPEIVKCSIKRAQKYFEDTQKDGAFSMFVLGQLIKLKNGFVGKVLDKYPNKLQIKLFDSNEDLFVSEAQIDLDASVKLKEAFVLRTTANELINVSNADESLVLKSEDDNPKQTLLAMLGSVLKKLAASKTMIEEKKASFADNKVVLSALGLEYYSLDDLNDHLLTLKASVEGLETIENYADSLNAITSAADVLDQFMNERSILASHTVQGNDAVVYANKIKQVIASISQTVVPSIVKVSTELQAVASELESAQTKRTFSSVVDKINKRN